MTRILILLIAALAFVLSGCSTTRKTTATESQAEAQLTATTDRQNHAGSTANAAIVTNVTTDERRNVVIDFTKVEFYPGGTPSEYPDSTAPGLNGAIIPGGSEGNEEQSKPPNVKSITTGRAVIEAGKTESRATEATAEATATEDSAIKADVTATQQEGTETKTEEKPKFTFWDWLYLITVGVFSAIVIIFAVRLVRKIKNAANNGG